MGTMKAVKLDDKDFLPEKMETWIVTDDSTGLKITINGDMISKDKSIENISSGYMHYFRTKDGLKKYSAFGTTIEKVEIIGEVKQQIPEKPEYPYELGKEYYSVGPLQKDGIEKWRFSNDKYDLSRLEIGNLFETEEEAINFKRKLIKMKEGF